MINNVITEFSFLLFDWKHRFQEVDNENKVEGPQTAVPLEATRGSLQKGAKNWQKSLQIPPS